MRAVDEDAEWQAVADAFPAASILQSAPWGRLKERWGWRVVRLVWGRRRVEAAAQVLLRRLPVLGGLLAYIPHGPLLAPRASEGDWRRILASLAAWAASHSVAVIKAELDVAAPGAAVARALGAEGWRRSHEAIQFPNTMVTDLTPGPEALLAAMKPKTRYNVRLAKRRGVVADRGGEGSLLAFWDLYSATARRDGFPVRPREYYLDAWRALLADNRATVILARRDRTALAGVIPVIQGQTAFYMYGASADQGRRHMGAYLAQWESMRWAMGRGCRRYDWWGGPTRLAPSDPLWGVYRFKVGFGARWLERLGPWDLPVSPWRYEAYRRLTGLRRGLLHRLH